MHTPGYPGFEGEVEGLRADPTPIADLTIVALIRKLEVFHATLDAPPILVGHSAGGAFLQVVMDHGYGSVGVALSSAPTEGGPWDAPPRRRRSCRCPCARSWCCGSRDGWAALST